MLMTAIAPPGRIFSRHVRESRTKHNDLDPSLGLNNAIVRIYSNVHDPVFTCTLKLHKETDNGSLLQHNGPDRQQWPCPQGADKDAIPISRRSRSLIYIYKHETKTQTESSLFMSDQVYYNH